MHCPTRSRSSASKLNIDTTNVSNVKNFIDDILSVVEDDKSFLNDYMKENTKERFMYITPFLDEVERVKKELPSFSDPKKVGGSKLLHLKELDFPR